MRENKTVEVILFISSSWLAINLYCGRPLEMAFLGASCVFAGGIVGKWAADLHNYCREKKEERDFQERMLKRQENLALVIASAQESGINDVGFLKSMWDKLKDDE